MIRVVLDTNLIHRICRKYRVKELALFGSATRDDFRPDSDVDVLVEFTEDAKIGLFGLMEMESELAAAFNRKVDLVTKPMLSPFFRNEVLARREVVYDRSR